jgi:Phosphotransferase enzyme family
MSSEESTLHHVTRQSGSKTFCSTGRAEQRHRHVTSNHTCAYYRLRETSDVSGAVSWPGQLDTCQHLGVRSLASVIEAAGTGPLEAEIFGTTDPSAIATVLSSLTRVATGTAVRGGCWYGSSVAAVAGVRLSDGREIVTRAYRPSVSHAFLDGVVRVQAHLVSTGFPCASPVSGPVEVDDTLGRCESILVGPGQRRFGLQEMAMSANGLAQLVRLTRDIDPAGLDANPMALLDTELYPLPHSPLFDFAATAAGAEWIDEIAAAARAAMTENDAVISHGDWSARNIRLGPAGLVGVFDWESLQFGPESTVVGAAAATWRALGEANEPTAPTAADIERFIHLYERGRSHPFSGDERRSARAAAVFTLAYTARCEHALQPGTRSGRASGRLAQDDGLRSLLS